MDIPDKYKFTVTHEWAKQEQAQQPLEITVGITEHAQRALGDIVFVDLPKVGQQVTKGKEFGVVESVKAASDIYAPISGEIIGVNDALNTSPELVNQSSYQAGWLVKIKPNNPDELGELLDAQTYQANIGTGF